MPDDDVAWLIERFATCWLAETPLGREILGAMSLDAAIDAIFESINAGLIKLTTDKDGLPVGFAPQSQPEPPKRPIRRPGKLVQ